MILEKKIQLQKIKEKKECPICSRIFVYTKNDVCSTCRSIVQRHTNKRKLVDMLGGKCKKCELTDIRCLTFHHLNPKDKVFTIAGSLSKSIDFLIPEAKKCILLCQNCHVIEHHKDITKIYEYFDIE